MFLHLTEVGARAIPLPMKAYKNVWILADEPFDPKGTAWTDGIEAKWTQMANDALDEVRKALEAVASGDA
jgi:hypothetical protein